MARPGSIAVTGASRGIGSAIVVELARRGEIEGVVTYCLDKTPGNPDLDAVARVYGAAASENAQ